MVDGRDYRMGKWMGDQMGALMVILTGIMMGRRKVNVRV